MKVNTTELRTHLSDYLTMANKEEIIITNKGIEIARIISPKQAKKRSLNNLVGILPSLTDEEIENIKNERISKQWSMNKYNLGDIVYFIANGYHSREATVIRTGSGFCTIKFNDNETPAGTRVRESKLFKTKQEAEIVVEKTHNTLLY